ncbi:MAG: hypothetical protein PHG75_08600 [Syntrophomonas sp.]|nr:hypothetical protein [Syntrophomonas sp.]
MRRRILDYLQRIDLFLTSGGSQTDWNDLLAEHRDQIGFFQHERLVHLIVTVTFGLVMVLLMNILLVISEVSLLFVLLFLFVIIFLLTYLYHYYILETSVQRMYVQYDQIRQRINNRPDAAQMESEIST